MHRGRQPGSGFGPGGELYQPISYKKRPRDAYPLASYHLQLIDQLQFHIQLILENLLAHLFLPDQNQF